MAKTFVSVAVQTEVYAVPLCSPWPDENEDTSHIDQGYYRRYNGTLGKIKNGVKHTESEDEHSSSHLAKRARYDRDHVSTSQESMLQKCDQ